MATARPGKNRGPVYDWNMKVDEPQPEPEPRPTVAGPERPQARASAAGATQAERPRKPDAVGCVFAGFGVQIVERSGDDYADYLDEL